MAAVSIKKRILISIVLLLCSAKSYAWSSYTHAEVAREALAPVAKAWGLKTPVTITSFEYFLKKFQKKYPQIQNKKDFAKWLKINGNVAFDQPDRYQEKIGAAITPLTIMSLYSPRTDDGRDTSIPYDLSEQFWFGAGNGTNTQAFRHMEKPAFDFLHPLDTGGFPLGKLGQATTRAQIYFDLAVLSYELEEPYWAWNFLGCGLHYTQDLSNPYHSAQLVPPIILYSLKAHWAWGKKRGWSILQTFGHIATNIHHYFEGWVEYQLLRKTSSEGKLFRESLRGNGEVLAYSSAQASAQHIRNFANTFVVETIDNTLTLTDDHLLKERVYQIGKSIYDHPENPDLFISPDEKQRTTAAFQISQVVLANFQELGKATRNIVRLFLEKTGQHF